MQLYRFSFCAVVGNGLKDCPWRTALDKIHIQNTWSKCNRVRGEQLQSSAHLFFTPHTQIFFILKAFSPNRHWLKWHHSRIYIRLLTAPSAGSNSFIRLCLHLQWCAKLVSLRWNSMRIGRFMADTPINEVRAGADTDLVDLISSLQNTLNRKCQKRNALKKILIICNKA